MIIYEDLHFVPTYAKAHGILMGVTFVVIFPLGAWVVRLVQSSKRVWLHASIQLLGWFMMLGGLGLGIRMGKILDRLENNAHTIIGTIVVVLMILQPFIGLIQHLEYRRKQRTTPWTDVHKYYGSILVVLAMINGGLGLQLANNTTKGKIAYGVIAGLSGVAFLALRCWPGPKRARGDAEEPPNVNETKQMAE